MNRIKNRKSLWNPIREHNSRWIRVQYKDGHFTDHNANEIAEIFYFEDEYEQ